MFENALRRPKIDDSGSMHRHEKWLENLRKSDPEEYIWGTTWASDVRHIQARITMNESF